MSRTGRNSFVQPLGVKSKSKGDLDTRTEGLHVSCMKCLALLEWQCDKDKPRAKTPMLLILALTKAAESRYVAVKLCSIMQKK